MKIGKILLVAILLLSVTTVMATHTPAISIKPTEWAIDTDADISLSVVNEGGDNIVMVELLVPETADQKPIYTVKEVSSPAGWTYTHGERFGESHPYKITWSTIGAGIAKDESLEFGLTVTSPSSLGEYEWKITTTDAKDESQTGIIKTSTSLAPLHRFEVTGEPKEVSAGDYFKITVKAYDEDGNIKTDYTGTLEFASTDEKAVLPKAYAFQAADGGSKSFNVKLKTAGNIVVLVADKETSISKISDVIKVNAGDLVSLEVTPDGSSANVNQAVEFKAAAKDEFDNLVDVTADVVWKIDEEAGGSWAENVYTTGNEGIWTVIGTYKARLVDGTVLTVKGVAPVVPPVEPVVPVEPVEPVVPTFGKMSITGTESISIAPGANDSLVLTVKNEGDKDLTEVKISPTGIPGEKILVYPEAAYVKAGELKDYLVIISLSENDTETITITFTASSKEGVGASMDVELTPSLGPTGIFVGLTKNLLQLGVVIVAVATVVIIAWELWFRKPKK